MLFIGRFIRNVAQQLDHVGSAIQGNYAYKEHLSRHRRLLALGDKKPVLKGDAFVAPNASVVGSVTVGEGSSVWYGSVIRGDVGKITIGDRTVIGDNTVIHVSSGPNYQFDQGAGTQIGSEVIIEQGSVVHGATLEDGCKIETNSIIFDGAVVEKNAVVGAGSLVTKGKRIPAGQLWAGTPARYVRDLTPEELQHTKEYSAYLRDLAKRHAFEHDKLPEWREEEKKFVKYGGGSL